jgi:hypothetical protein
VFSLSTPAGATPMPDNPKRTVTGLETISPFCGLMKYSLTLFGVALGAGLGVVLGVGLGEAVWAAAVVAKANPPINARMKRRFI